MPSKSKSLEKRNYILEKAEQVFQKKGYRIVTMKDIVEECGISRGGLYLYFSSVKEIFMEVLALDSKRYLNQVKINVSSHIPFNQIIDDFFLRQKQQLLFLDKTLAAATMEFYLTYKDELDQSFIVNKLQTTKYAITNMLEYGVMKKEIGGVHLISLAEHILYTLQGMMVISMTSGISKKTIENQLSFLKDLIYAYS